MKRETTGEDSLTRWSFDSLEDAVLVADDMGIVRQVNNAFADLFSAGTEQVVGMGRRGQLEPFSRHFRDPELVAKNLTWLYDHPAEEERATWELADGRGLLRWCSRPVRDVKGKICGRMECYRKIDEGEIGLCGIERESLDAISAGILLVGDRLNIIWHNRAAGEFIADVLGFDPRELESLDAIGHDEPLVRALVEAIGNAREVRKYGLQMGSRYFDLVVTPLASPGRVSGAVAALVDAGPQHEAMARSERLRREAEFYVDLMSHDIRNFNQVSMGYLEMLQISEGLGPDERMYLEKALGGVTGSNKLIEDIKRIRLVRESGGKDIVPTDLGQAIAEDVRHVASVHEGQDIVINANAGAGRMVLANGLVHEVFRHILENAIKYDHHQDKVIDIDIVESERDGKGYWTVRIADHGPGIPDARKKTIFERMAGGSTRGAGLGLSIVRLIVDRLGGRIWVEDRVPGDQSQGSVFVVQLRKA